MRIGAGGPSRATWQGEPARKRTADAMNGLRRGIGGADDPDRWGGSTQSCGRPAVDVLAVYVTINIYWDIIEIFDAPELVYRRAPASEWE